MQAYSGYHLAEAALAFSADLSSTYSLFTMPVEPWLLPRAPPKFLD
jgi:hypothetical protein